MRRIALAVLGFCIMGFSVPLTSNTAAAGEYYRSYSGHSGHAGYSRGNVRYSSSCCYRKVVRIERKVNYVRVDTGRRHGYYAPRYRSSNYYGSPYRPAVYSQPYRTPVYYGRPDRYDGGEYAGRPSGYRVNYSGNYGGGYSGGYSGPYADRCVVRRVRVSDGYGGWDWVRSRVCY